MRQTTLSNLAVIKPGYPFRGRIEPTQPATVAVVQMKDIRTNLSVDWTSCTASNLPGKRTPDWLAAGDILMAGRGSRSYAVLLDASTPTNAVAAPHFFHIQPDRQQVVPAYLAWLLNQQPCQHYLDRNAEGSYTKSLRRHVLEALPLILPSLQRQRQYRQLIDNLQTQWHNLHQQLEANQALQTALAQDLFTTQQG